MAPSNVDAIYAEYPFLERVIPRIEVSAVQVNRWDKELLTYSGSGTEEIYLIDEHGNIITCVGTPIGRFLGFFLFGLAAETVGRALARIKKDKVRRIRYAVRIHDMVTLYKLPRGYNNAWEWLCSTVTEARKTFQQP